MQSEIPQIQVVTAIADADAEDYLSQLLFSQGWSIVFRAFDFEGLSNFLTERGANTRTILIYKSDLPGLVKDILQNFESPAITLINIDGIGSNAHLLMSHIRSQLRLPLIVQDQASAQGQTPTFSDPEGSVPRSSSHFREDSQYSKKVAKVKNIAVTGTTGAPGRSLLALNIANYAAAFGGVSIIDADVRSQSIEYLVGRSEIGNSNLGVHRVDPSAKPNSLARDHNLTTKLNIFDIGALPPLEEVVTDRRWQAGLINSILEQTTTLIYICKSTGLSLIRLEAFMSQFPILIRKLPIIYLLNQSGSTREDRALEKRFLSMVSGEAKFVLPIDSKVNRIFSAPSKRNSPFNKEIGRIVTELK